MNRYLTLALLAMLAGPRTGIAAALDDINLEISSDLCAGAGANDKNYIVYATNVNSNQSIDANFRYDSSPAQQHFILFDAGLNPVTDRFPKFHTRRLAPRETAPVGCSFTYRASPRPPGPLAVPVVIVKQSASYVGPNAAETPAEDARSFAAFVLQGGINECGPGAKPPGLFYLVNLHPFARLSASINLFDDHGTRIGVVNPNLSALSTTRIGCSNGSSRPGPITGATLEMPSAVAASPPPPVPPAPLPSAPKTQFPEAREPQPVESSPLAPLPLGAVLRTQNVCAGSVPPGWIKINDAWNPTVCGNPGTITYNVWTIQQLSDQPQGAVIHACRGPIPASWVVVGTFWNPTVCGHPTANQPNVMAIKRLN